MSVRGKCQIEIRIGTWKGWIEFKVVEDIGEEVIIGNDILKREDVKIDFETELVEFGQDNYVSMYIRKEKSMGTVTVIGEK